MAAKKRRSGGKRYTQAQVDKLVYDARCAAEDTGYEMGRKEGKAEGAVTGIIEGRAMAFMESARVAVQRDTVLIVPPKTAEAVIHYLSKQMGKGTWEFRSSDSAYWAAAIDTRTEAGGE